MLLIHIKTLEDTYKIIADSKDTILFLKVKIHELSGTEKEKQTIIYRGTKLEDSVYLEELGLPEDSQEPVYMYMVIYKDAIATVQIKKDNDIVLETKWDYSKEDKVVLHLKRELGATLKLPPLSIRNMEFYQEDGTKLENGQSIKDLIKKEQCESFVFTVIL